MELDFSKIKTYSVKGRHNLVRIETLKNPLTDSINLVESQELDILAQKLKDAKKCGRGITCFYGAHVIKCGLSRYLLWLVENGYITHLASNGAGSIHDFELAYLGGTSEHVPTAIEDGSFGMWEETGYGINRAIIEGNTKGYGYGRSLYEYVKANETDFPNRNECVFYMAQQMGAKVTYHVTIGTDIIHQHPTADFGAIGASSGRDFKSFTTSLSTCTGGVHINIGSSVTGPEVFLKALAICRNLGYGVDKITTANFDIIPLGDYKKDVGYDNFHYYYRPRKNVINRPTSLGGVGLYVELNHEISLPNLYARLK